MVKDILGYEGLYTIDEDGNVYSLTKHCYLKPQVMNSGYYRVGLYKDGKYITAMPHRLVAEHFVDNPDNLPCVNHRDENKLNNNYQNLEWCDHKYNNNYGTHNQNLSNALTNRTVEWAERPVAQYTKSGEFIASYKSLIEAERKTGIKYRSIQQVAAQYPYRKSAGGYVWRYAEDEQPK